jgi:two-component system sensor histidine kinase FlrB
MQRRHIADALLNVLQNAREAVEAKEGNVWIAANCLPDSTVEISIRDDGAGIPADRQERIFEAYYTTKEKGTGLGLATVKHNIELYGGTIRVESEPGAGARFLLRLPPRAALQVSV